MAFCGHVSLWFLNHKGHAAWPLHEEEANTLHILAFWYGCLQLPACFQLVSMNGHTNIVTC